ncbi:MAG TPA: glutamyl-tRNA reductase, partial [Terriglobales bacterium]
GNSEVTEELRKAWQFAQQQGSTGRFLDAVLHKALTAAQHARVESGLTDPSFALQYAPVAIATEIFGSLTERKVLLVGTGRMSALAAAYLLKSGARDITIATRTTEHAQDLAAQIGARVIPYSQLLPELQQADLVISATSSSSGYVVNAEELDIVVRSRQNLPLLIVDLSVPRDIDPAARQITGVHFYDLDDLEGIVERNTVSSRVVAETAERVLLQELQGFRSRLLTENVVPTIVALRHRLEEICGQELSSLEAQFGPFTEDQQHALHSLASHITQRIAGSMARELKQMPEQSQQQQLTEAVQRLFHLELAGHATSSHHQ